MTLALVKQALTAGARLAPACALVGVHPKTYRRWASRPDGEDRRAGPTAPAPHALTAEERQRIVAVATGPECRDLSPKQIVPRLADKGEYIASESSFYRVLRDAELMAHRGPARPPQRVAKPAEHHATGPCQVWTWDITYLRGPVRGSFFYLYLFLDIYSRKIVGAEVHPCEDMALSSTAFEAARRRENATGPGLVLHADNGGPMKGSTMLATLQQLGVVASFSRPRVSDDNPYSEAAFRTLKYCPSFPKKPFASLDEARRWVEGFVRWYNDEHLHSGVRFVTPRDRHEGRDVAVLAHRHAVYTKARERTPRRWARQTRNWNPAGPVVLNPATRELRMTA